MTYKILLLILQKITSIGNIIYICFSVAYILILLYYLKIDLGDRKRHFYVRYYSSRTYIYFFSIKMYFHSKMQYSISNKKYSKPQILWYFNI